MGRDGRKGRIVQRGAPEGLRRVRGIQTEPRSRGSEAPPPGSMESFFGLPEEGGRLVLAHE